MAVVATLEENEVERIVSIRVDQIDLGDRLRAVDRVWAQAIGRVMSREGQRTPIEVCRLPGSTSWMLVTGAHRLSGAREEGIEYLKAIVVGAGRIERRMREVSENLWRKGLAPFDRATFIAELHTLLKLQAGFAPEATAKQIAASARWQAKDAEDTMSSAYGFEGAIAEQLGLAGRTIRRDLMLHRGLAPSVMARLVDHSVVNNASELRALAKLAPDTQRLAVDLLLAGTAKRVGEAVALLQQRPVKSAEDKRLAAFVGAFYRMGVAEKCAAIEHLLARAPVAVRTRASETLRRGDDQ